jgi:hypothetical protein
MRLLVIVAMIFLGGASGAVAAGPLPEGLRTQTELSAQRKHPRLRIYRAPAAYDYPRPGYYSYPGPNAVRVCSDWYRTENRPSGTVVTPQMRCRWVPG